MSSEQSNSPAPVTRRALRPRTLQSILAQAVAKEEECENSLQLLRAGTEARLENGRWCHNVEELYHHSFKLLGNGKREKVDASLKEMLNNHCSTKVIGNISQDPKFWPSLQKAWTDYSLTLDDMVYLYRHMESVHVPRDGVQRLGKLAFHEKVLLHPEVRQKLSECLKGQEKDTIEEILKFLEVFGMSNFLQES